MLRRILTAVVVLGCVIVLAGCNTLRGFGKDVEKAGEGIQKAVK